MKRTKKTVPQNANEGDELNMLRIYKLSRDLDKALTGAATIAYKLSSAIDHHKQAGAYWSARHLIESIIHLNQRLPSIEYLASHPR